MLRRLPLLLLLLAGFVAGRAALFLHEYDAHAHLDEGDAVCLVCEQAAAGKAVLPVAAPSVAPPPRCAAPSTTIYATSARQPAPRPHSRAPPAAA